ncbi:hypothetical protein Tco_0885108 [Tanacetum coccineum]
MSIRNYEMDQRMIDLLCQCALAGHLAVESSLERFLALGWHLEEIHVTWAHLEKKRTRLRTYTKSLGRNVYSAWGRRLDFIRRRLDYFETASRSVRLKKP